jgi:hypothetical protein
MLARRGVRKNPVQITEITRPCLDTRIKVTELGRRGVHAAFVTGVPPGPVGVPYGLGESQDSATPLRHLEQVLRAGRGVVSQQVAALNTRATSGAGRSETAGKKRPRARRGVWKRKKCESGSALGDAAADWQRFRTLAACPSGTVCTVLLGSFCR